MFAPAARSVPEAEEMETNEGAPKVAVQFNGAPPVFSILNGWDAAWSPFDRLKESALVSSASTGGVSVTLSVMLIVCGLPLIGAPPLTVAREIEPVYFPRARADDVTFTLNVVLPLVMVVAEGVTASQPLPDAIVTVGVMVTPSVQAPVIPIVKLCDDGLGFDPI